MSTPEARPVTRSIEAQIEIAAPIEAVWKALTDAEEMTRWFPLEAGTNPDGTVWMGWGEGYRFTSRVAAADPPRYLRVTPVLAEGAPPTLMMTEIFLESRRGKTLLRLVNSGFLAGPGWDQEYEGTRTGWAFQLFGLKNYLERHAGTPRAPVWVRAVHGLPAQEAWRRLTAAGGLFEVAVGQLQSGQRYRLRTEGGDTLEGVIQAWNPPYDFSATVENWNHACLRLQCDDLPLRGVRDSSLWFSTYGVPHVDTDRFRTRVAQAFARLFPEATKRTIR